MIVINFDEQLGSLPCKIKKKYNIENSNSGSPTFTSFNLLMILICNCFEELCNY